MNLFQKQNIILHSGQKSDFKIECDCLTDEDFECLAYLIAKKFKFSAVIGVPEGGLLLENYLKQYSNNSINHPILIVDDVFTTGRSMEEMRFKTMDAGHTNIRGVVVFARKPCPYWIKPIFQMWD